MEALVSMQVLFAQRPPSSHVHLTPFAVTILQVCVFKWSQALLSLTWLFSRRWRRSIKRFGGVEDPKAWCCLYCAGQQLHGPPNISLVRGVKMWHQCVLTCFSRNCAACRVWEALLLFIDSLPHPTRFTCSSEAVRIGMLCVQDLSLEDQ